MIRLSGSQNPTVKETRSLKNKSDREEKKRYFIEGARFVSEARNENANILYLMVSDSFCSDDSSEGLLARFTEQGIECYQLPDSLFASVSDTQNPQGILAVLGMERRQLEEAEAENGFFLLLDNIRDPGNMGTIIRTADAAGCSGIIIPEGCVDVYNPKVLRSTMGSIFHIPMYHCGKIENATGWIKSKGIKLCASYLEGSTSIYDADLTGPIALVIGSEAEGIGQCIMETADLLIRIPMQGRAESLNASVAAGVMMFEAMRQRRSEDEK